ncbi:bifunctional 3-(3-hydroxy-phenyl)propionate/3-hydroxycinnamic acid hydroxylase MhpA [Amycolatopsis pithecellobii]|uniref:3-(3-hydroxyphenyl)propionate hydroxylase n=1 Tax=Amycolatopsis pithecellobii TaxID=664692 RepID=A0A6N7YXB7_9PSEU|nr:bifunctional 3-(3-hydroxy-phenyl)propionate/3-hydroxycinnamic acid hydroxylase [Amycolatopsis pithecellobii]MTD56572.1 3-(3-hydroxyphenyl)propionate hydroxylase [Amycolatopsis pithecellobii]
MNRRTSDVDTEVLIVGAGPVGLTLGNLLGLRGQKVTIIESRSALIDYPRGVGLDDESFRTIQTMGLAEQISQHTVPQHIMRLVNGRGQVLVTNNPTTDEFGWPRKHGFVQPLVDRELLAGLGRFDTVDVRFGHELVDLHPAGNRVRAVVSSAAEGESAAVEITARYVVGCEGGRSRTRELMGVEFEGKSPPTRWLVVDVANDPLGTPNAWLGADPRRPYVSIGLPHGIRRWEFMLFDDESDDLLDGPEFMAGLLRPHVPDPNDLSIIGRRVYTHHGRLATSFRAGRLLLAGDAAHLMPVWLGQGWNSGIRDATNLAWKLTSVLRGFSRDELLDTYDQERRAHASAMIELNMTAGSIMTLGPMGAAIRDIIARGINVLPTVKSYFTDMRFKPMPRYAQGVVVDENSGEPGRSAAALVRKLVQVTNAPHRKSAVGTQFIQPRVQTARGETPLDDVIGNWWAIAAWAQDPSALLSAADLEHVKVLGARLVCMVPGPQRAWAEREYAGSPVTVLGDHTGRLKTWFDDRAAGVLFLRPDRFIAAACLAQETSKTFAAVLRAMSYDAYGTSAEPSDNTYGEPKWASP